MAPPSIETVWPLNRFCTKRYTLSGPHLELRFVEGTASFVVVHLGALIQTGPAEKDRLRILPSQISLVDWSPNTSAKGGRALLYRRESNAHEYYYWCGLEAIPGSDLKTLIKAMESCACETLVTSKADAGAVDPRFWDMLELGHDEDAALYQPALHKAVHPTTEETAVTEYLWRTGNWADLIVIAGGIEFRVHKSIVCVRSAFFNNACRHEFLEAQEGRICLEEGSVTIAIILKSLYGVTIDCLEETSTAFEVLDDAEKSRELDTLVNVYEAAGKYLLDSLKSRVITAVGARLSLVEQPMTIASLGRKIYDATFDEEDALRREIRNAAQNHLHGILTDQYAKAVMMGNVALIEDLLGKFDGFLAAKEKDIARKGAKRGSPTDGEKSRLKRIRLNTASQG